MQPRESVQNPYAERVIGSIRRECLDHVIVLGEGHLRRLLSAYLAYTTEVGRISDWAKTRLTADSRNRQAPDVSSQFQKLAASITDTSVGRRNVLRLSSPDMRTVRRRRSVGRFRLVALWEIRTDRSWSVDA